MARRLSFLVAASILAAGCAADPELDIGGLEGSVADALVPVVVDDVSCPSPLPVGAQQVICVGLVEGVSIDIVVGIDDESAATVTVSAPLLDVGEVATEAGARLSADLGVEAVVSCPPPLVVVIDPGATIACLVVDVDTGVERPLTITVLGLDGAWEMDLTP